MIFFLHFIPVYWKFHREPGPEMSCSGDRWGFPFDWLSLFFGGLPPKYNLLKCQSSGYWRLIDSSLARRYNSNNLFFLLFYSIRWGDEQVELLVVSDMLNYNSCSVIQNFYPKERPSPWDIKLSITMWRV